MKRLAGGLVFVVGLASLLYITGCDVTQQVIDTIGLAGDIAGIWVK
jgi:hypothetical protein